MPSKVQGTTRNNIGLLLHEVGRLTGRDVNTAETFIAAFASVFITDHWPWSPELEDHGWGNDKLPANPALVWDLLLQMSVP